MESQINIVLCGVGGQGILSMAYVLSNAAMDLGLNVKQAEVHGMSQRGGAVESHLRISSRPLYSDLIALGQAQLLLSVEPLESLRYLSYLACDGCLVSSTTPFVNIGSYPDLENVKKVWRQYPHIALDAAELAKQAGSSLAQGMVMLGAAATKLPFDREQLRLWVAKLWQAKGEQIVVVNTRAFDLGFNAANQLQAEKS